MKMIELASERLWRSALIPFRKTSKVLSTYIYDMLPIKKWVFTSPSRLDRSSDQSSRQAGQMDFIHLLKMKSWTWNQVRNLSRLDKSRSYSRVTCLLSTARIELEEILKYELSPALLSLFGSNGEMRHSTSKSDLKKKASNRGIWTTSI